MTSVRDFGAKGDGQTDDTAAFQHALGRCDGELFLPRGDYILSKPLVVALDQLNRFAIRGTGTAKLLMTGPGPAFHLVGTHARSALPEHILPHVWAKERMPTLTGFEIEGRHPEADGVRMEGVMQPTLTGVLIRKVRHGIHIVKRCRNVIIDACHVYHNTGIGVFLDGVNLHQIIIADSHISYCKRGGIRVEKSEIRNIEVVGNDIEYNHDPNASESADVCYDCREGTVREGVITGNNIQAVPTPGGANVRLLGVGPEQRTAVGLLAITGNLIGSQETLLHLVSCLGVSVTGNALYSGDKYALHAAFAQNLSVSGNIIDHNPEYKGPSTDMILLEGCRNVTVTGLTADYIKPATFDPPATIELRDCDNVSITGSQIVGARTRGVLIRGKSTVVRVADCTIRGSAETGFRAAIEVEARATRVMVTNNFLAKGSAGDLLLPAGTGTANGNQSPD